MKKIIQLNSGNRELYNEVANLFFRNFPNHPAAQDMYFDGKIPAERILVIVDKGELLGGMKRGYNFDRDVVTIDFLAIAESCRGGGIGTKLLLGFESYLSERRIKRVGLQSRINPAVGNFYRKNGYSDISGYLPFWMEKQLV